MLTAVAVFVRQGMPLLPSAAAAAAMLLLTAAASRRWRLYEKHRTLVVSLARLAALLATCANAFLSLPLSAQAWGAAFLRGGGSGSSGAAHAAAVALASGRARAGDARGGGGGPSSALASNAYAHFGAGVPAHWIAAAANSPPWARHWSAFFTRTPRVQALLLPSLLVVPPRAHALVSVLCALAATAVLGSTVAGREALFGREKHVEVARVLSALTRWLVRLPSSTAAAALRGAGRPRPACAVADDRATAAVMLAMQVCLGLLLPTHVIFSWQAQARRTFRDSELARRKKREEEEEEEGEGGEGEEVGVASRRRRRRQSLSRRPPSSPRPSAAAAAAAAAAASAPLARSARIDSVLLALGLQVSAVVCFWFVLEELDALAGERTLWFSLPPLEDLAAAAAAA